MLFRKLCGVDLGTDSVKISDKHGKLTLSEKNMLAVRNNVHVIAVGDRAFEIYGKAPKDVEVECPMKNGAVADMKNMEIVLTGLLKRFSAFYCKHPDILVALSTDLNEVEKRAYYYVLNGNLHAKRIALVDKGIADAAGLGIPLNTPEGNIIVNMGGATTEISVISNGKTIIGRSIRGGGKAMDESIIHFVRKRYDLNIGEKTAEKLKNKLGYVCQGPKLAAKAFGIHAVSGLPKSAVIPSLDISIILTEQADEIIAGIQATLGRTPPQLLEDIRKNGIYLTGGVSQIPNLAGYMQKELGIPVYNVMDPAMSTVRGLALIARHTELHKLTYSLKELIGSTI